jgi:putative heme transporter
VPNTETKPPTSEDRPTRWWLRGLVALVVLVAIFGFGLPRLADYGEAWDAITAMTRYELAVIALVGAWNLYTYWPVMTAALPGLRTREAMVVNQASTAVANSVPGGGAIALAVTFRILRAWGFTAQSITNQVVATGAANMLAKLTMPVLALFFVTVTGQLRGTFLWLALAGLVVTTLVGVIGAVVLRAEESTQRVGRLVDRTVARVRWREPDAEDRRIERWLLDLRAELDALARRNGVRLLVATFVSHLSLYVVLLVTLRNVGVSEDDVSWSLVFAVFAFVRLLSALPVTPGGAGVVELGYVGFLGAEAPGGASGRVAAGVLVFRAVTFVLPLLLGSIAWVVFQAMTSWRQPPDTRGQLGDA